MKYQNIGVDLGERFIKISILQEVQISEKNLEELQQDEDKDNIEYKISSEEKYYVPEDLDINKYFKFVEKSIKNFSKTNKLKGIRINFTIPCDNDNLIAKSMKIPRVDDSILEDSILFEVESSTPIDRKKYKHTYEIIQEFPETNEILILSTLIKKDLIEKILNLRKSRWKIEQLEPQFYIGNKVLIDDASLIDFGFYTTRVYLYKNGILSDIDIIPIGTNDFIEQIKLMYDVNLHQAEEILRLTKINNPLILDDLEDESLKLELDDDLKELIESLTDITKNIIEDIKRNIRVMELNNNIVIENMYYTGEITQLENFIDYISDEVNISMVPLNFITIDNLNISESIKDFVADEITGINYDDDLEDLLNEANKVESFIYSAIANLENNSNFNFLKGIKFYIDKNSLLVGLICATIFMHLGFFIINTNYEKKINMGSMFLTDINNSNSQLEREIMDLNDNMERNKTIINRVENLKDKKKWLSDILYVLPGDTPTNTGIVYISIEAGHAVLKGFSEDYSSIGYLAMALEDYGEVTITEVGEKKSTKDYRVEGNVKMYKEFIMEITYDHRLINDEEITKTIDEHLDNPNKLNLEGFKELKEV